MLNFEYKYGTLLKNTQIALALLLCSILFFSVRYWLEE